MQVGVLLRITTTAKSFDYLCKSCYTAIVI